MNYEKTMKEWDDSVPDGIKYLSAEKQVLMRRVRELESENARLKDAQRWIPVSERLPKEKQSVLALDRTGTAYHWEYSKCLSNIFVSDYTHWMPLPGMPEAEE